MNNKLKICVSLIVYTALYRGKNLEKKSSLFFLIQLCIFIWLVFYNKKIINFDNINNLTYINLLLVKKKEVVFINITNIYFLNKFFFLIFHPHPLPSFFTRAFVKNSPT